MVAGGRLDVLLDEKAEPPQCQKMVRKGDLSVDQIGASWFETARAYCAVRRGLAYARPARARAPPHHEGLERRHLFSPHPEERPTGRVSKDGRDRTADTAPHSRGAICVRALREPVSLHDRGRRECRVFCAPAASYAEWKKHTSIVTTGSPKRSGIPCTTVLSAAPCSPRCIGLVSHRRLLIISTDLTPASRGQDHTA